MIYMRLDGVFDPGGYREILEEVIEFIECFPETQDVMLC